MTQGNKGRASVLLCGQDDGGKKRGKQSRGENNANREGRRQGMKSDKQTITRGEAAERSVSINDSTHAERRKGKDKKSTS